MNLLQTKGVLGLVTFMAFAVGCRPEVRAGSPRPNVAIAGDQAPAELEIGQTVPNDFETPQTSVASIKVHDWHTTLNNGFQSAFAGATSSSKLQILLAELSFAPAAVTSTGGVRAVQAQIRYKVRVVDASGEEVGVATGTVSAREANSAGTDDAMTTNASLAVEAMYEAIASQIAGN